MFLRNNKHLASLLSLTAFPLAFLCLNLLIFTYIQSEHTVYYWDLILYWHRYQQVAPLLSHNILQYLDAVRQSVATDAYNNLPVILLTPFYYVLGPGRPAYVIAVVLAYALPAYLVFFYLVDRLVPHHQKLSFNLRLLILFGLFFGLPDTLAPILRGYLDVGALVFIFAGFYLYWRQTRHGALTFSWPVTFTLGTLLAWLALFRRYFLDFGLAFVLAAGLIELVLIVKKRRSPTTALVFFTVLVATMLGWLWLVSGRLFSTLFLTDYRALYAGYRANFSLVQAALDVVKNFGLLPTVLIICAFGFTWKHKPYRRITGLALLTLIITTGLFWRIQSFEDHHYYLIIGPILVVVALLLLHLCRSRWRLTVIPLFILFSVWNACQAFSPTLINYRFQVAGFPLFSGKYLPPLQRHDIAKLKQIVTWLQINDAANGTIYVGASSPWFSDDILRNVCYEMYGFSGPLCRAVIGSAQVDSRDGYPLAMFAARFIIITDPIQYHLPPNKQRAVTYVSRFIQHNPQDYRLRRNVEIDQGIRVQIYERTRWLGKAMINGWNDLNDW